MAWIESHQSLAQHRKTITLSDLLKKDIPTVVGHLHLTWWWCLDNASDGCLDGITPAMLARAAMWKGKPGVFWDAMVEARFINQTEAGYELHDWWEYAGKLVNQRSASKEQRKIGGQRRMASMTSEQKTMLAQQAAHARWDASRMPANASTDLAEMPATVPTVPTNSTNQKGPAGMSPSPGKTDPLITAYEEQFGVLITAGAAQSLHALAETYTEAWVIDALKQAQEAGKRRLDYVRGILSRWATEGRKPKTQPPAYIPEAEDMTGIAERMGWRTNDADRPGQTNDSQINTAALSGPCVEVGH